MEKRVTFRISKGFTLIELLVVIVIIAILSGIGIRYFTKAFQDARNTHRAAAVRNAGQIIEQAFAVKIITTTDPTKDMNASGEDVGVGNSPQERITSILLKAGGYELPPTSTTGFDYYYVYDTGGKNFAIINCLERENKILVYGTTQAKNALHAAQDSATPICTSTGVDITNLPSGYAAIKL